MTGRSLLALGLFMLAAVVGSCRDDTSPVGPEGSARVRISMAISETGGGVVEAYDRVDALFVRFLANDEVRFEDELPFDPTGSESTVRVQVPLRAATETFELYVELRSGGQAVFSGGGTAELAAGSGSAVETSLHPVIAGVACSREPIELASYGQVVTVRGAALFATGDTIPATQIDWSSSAEAVATVSVTGAVTARGDGEAQITCGGGGFSDSLLVNVFAVVNSLEIAPPDATAAEGTSVTFTSTLRDASENVITAPRPIVWASSNTDVATVGPTGDALALATGTTSITATIGSATDSALLTVVAVPTVQTVDATVDELQVELRGLVNPEGLVTEAWFEWGTDAGLASSQSTEAQVVAAGTADVEVSDFPGELAVGATYYFRIVAQNSAGVSRGAILSFATSTPPTVETVEATITGQEVELLGLVNPEGLATEAWFEWGTDPSLAGSQSTEAQAVGAGTADVEVIDFPIDLAVATTYYFRIVGQNSAGTSRGEILSFTTPAPPTVQTIAATVGDGEVDLQGIVNPEGQVTEAWFEWGSDPNLANPQSTQRQSLSPGTADVAISDFPGEFALDNTYYFRAAAQNSTGISRGAILTFRVPAAPTVETLRSSVDSLTIEVFASIDPHSSDTQAWFEWGTDPALASPAATPFRTVTAGTVDFTLSEVLPGIVPSTTYYFRAVATSEGGRSDGDILSFATAGPPTAHTLEDSTTADEQIMLNATVNSHGYLTTAYFEMDVDSAFARPSTTELVTISASHADVDISVAIGELMYDTIYYFRIVARNSAGAVTGEILTFRTFPPPEAMREAAVRSLLALRDRPAASLLALIE